jgi:hypothetical protein
VISIKYLLHTPQGRGRLCVCSKQIRHRLSPKREKRRKEFSKEGYPLGPRRLLLRERRGSGGNRDTQNTRTSDENEGDEALELAEMEERRRRLREEKMTQGALLVANLIWAHTKCRKIAHAYIINTSNPNPATGQFSVLSRSLGCFVRNCAFQSHDHHMFYILLLLINSDIFAVEMTRSSWKVHPQMPCWRDVVCRLWSFFFRDPSRRTPKSFILNIGVHFCQNRTSFSVNSRNGETFLTYC